MGVNSKRTASAPYGEGKVKVLPSLCPYFLSPLGCVCKPGTVCHNCLERPILFHVTMPELPEVERAAKLLRDVAKGRQVMKVDTFDDQIVYAGTTHQEFEQELSGRVVKDVQRYGKSRTTSQTPRVPAEPGSQARFSTYFWKEKGSTLCSTLYETSSSCQVKGKAPFYYRENGRKKANVDEWPPRFTKFVLHIVEDPDPTGEPAEAGPLAPVSEVDKGSIQESSTIQIAFLDPRRLARIRLCSSPLTEPPICDLGFDPILSMPSLEAFSARVRKRSCPIKALLLDQSFSAGVGNWVADEILYHARVHPEQRCNVLSEGQIQQLYDKTVYVAKTAVDVNADDSLFPKDWLFKHRWGKGKKNSDDPLLLPSGQPATIKFITVGGRTSAYVSELQRLQKNVEAKSSKEARDDSGGGEESDLTPLAESDADPEPAPKPSSQTRSSARKRKATKTTYRLAEVLVAEPEPAPKRRRESRA
ncbi:hypothetical protein D9611_003431 [Ephemerocybe angulata]|uniref:Formamidopyrimidine-DNA glycosylase catalytic domain-containing protein n=1 Tax=Ephemerocybe angulata TaxID=980116 RepID=A0A8H5C8N7_9AGAR|nr:hypothetical protein D9611_003431 [Tulosesus angulatus]